MGVVYSREEVSGGNVPYPEDFEVAARHMLEVFFNHDSDYVESAMVYGSTALGSPSRRSDLDILLVHSREEDLEALAFIHSVLDRTREVYGVHIEPNILSSGSLMNERAHTIDPLFALHLSRFADDPNWSRNDPLRDLGIDIEHGQWRSRENLADSAADYLAGKVRKFGGALAQGFSEQELKVLQRVFELPHAIGRKLVPAVMGIEQASVIEDKEVSMRITLDMLSHPDYLKPRDAILSLSEMDREYSEILDATLEDPRNIREYMAFLESVYLESCILAYRAAQGGLDYLLGATSED